MSYSYLIHNTLNTGAYVDYDHLIVKLDVDAKLVHGHLEGHYTLASTAVNGKHYWIHHQGAYAIWYDKEFNNWKIGHKLDFRTGICGLHSTNDTTGPEEVTTWKYWNENDEWKSTSNIFKSPSMHLLFQNSFASYFLLI